MNFPTRRLRTVARLGLPLSVAAVAALVVAGGGVARAAAGGGGGSRDHKPPTTPAGLHTTSVTSRDVGLAWDASTDNVAVTGYDVYRDSKLLTSVTGTSAVDGSVQPSKTYAYQVRAHDAAGNASALTATVSATAPADPGGGGGTSYEAEAAVLAGGAVPETCTVCSGGKKVTDIGNGGTVTFNVTASAAGSNTMTVYYLSTNAKSAVITVNGKAQTVAFPPTGSGKIEKTMDVTIQLKAGANTVEFGNPQKGAPYLDRIVV